ERNTVAYAFNSTPLPRFRVGAPESTSPPSEGRGPAGLPVGSGSNAASVSMHSRSGSSWPTLASSKIFVTTISVMAAGRGGRGQGHRRWRVEHRTPHTRCHPILNPHVLTLDIAGVH